MENTLEIRIKRLVLGKFTKADVNVFFSIMSDKEANKFLPRLPLRNLEEATYFLQKKYLKS